MPPVKKRKKTTAKKKSSARGRSRQSAGDVLRERLSQLWSGVLTYVAVGLCVVALATVVMLAAGGYFANFGERIDSLTGRAGKMVGFSVTRVTAKGQGDVSDRELMAALRDDIHGEILGRSLLNLDAAELRGRVEGLPWVRSAAVQKLWPNTVHVTIIEREPIAMWQDETLTFHLIDREGVPLDVVEDSQAVGLPVLVGTADPRSALKILTALEQHDALFERVASVISVNDRRYDLRFRNDFTAKLPETEVEAALERLDGLGAGTGRLAKTLKYLDLRDPRWAYFRPKSS